MTAVRAPGHSYRGTEINAYGDRRYVCECGDRGSPTRAIVEARAEHRIHKLQVTTPHLYRKARRQFGSICGECGQSRSDLVHTGEVVHEHQGGCPEPRESDGSPCGETGEIHEMQGGLTRLCPPHRTAIEEWHGPLKEAATT